MVYVFDRDKVASGGGVEGEHENIEVFDIPFLQFIGMVEYCNDLKTRMIAYESFYRGFLSPDKIEDVKKNNEKKSDKKRELKQLEIKFENL